MYVSIFIYYYYYLTPILSSQRRKNYAMQRKMSTWNNPSIKKLSWSSTALKRWIRTEIR